MEGEDGVGAVVAVADGDAAWVDEGVGGESGAEAGGVGQGWGSEDGGEEGLEAGRGRGRLTGVDVGVRGEGALRSELEVYWWCWGFGIVRSVTPTA